MVLQLQFRDLLVNLLCLAKPLKQYLVNGFTGRELEGQKQSYLLDNTKEDG